VVLVALLLASSAAWAALALLYYDHLAGGTRAALAVAFTVLAAATLGAALRRAWRARALTLYGLLFAAVLAAWSALRPANDRDWIAEVARLSFATRDGPLITVHNIRNFHYRSETDFTPAYYDRTFDLRRLSGVDLIASYWMGAAIAHIFLSFEFDGHEHLAISIEARRARGEPYSSLGGFFRRFELVYVVGDERDLIGVRTNYRRDPPEQVYLYRLRGAVADGQRLFLAYIGALNRLVEHPEFYNSLTSNCTGSIWELSRVNPDHPPYSWQLLLSGYVPAYLYEHGRLDTSIPFATLEARAHINTRAAAAGDDADFSARIRALPRAAVAK